ncbi:hypothetical protein Tco_0408204 [Tanacetum coccineum]
MGDENPIRTLGYYSKPSHEGYRNTIELPVGNNMVPLRSDTIRLVQNGCLFYRLRSKDPNQHLKDFLKLVDSLDLDGENKERMRLTDKKSLILASTFGSMSKFFMTMSIPSQDEPLTNRPVNDPRDFAKSVKAIPLPQDVPSTSNRRLIELENQVQRLMEAHLAPMQPNQVNKVTTSYDMISKVNLLWKTVSENLDDTPLCDTAGGPTAQMNFTSTDYHTKEEIRSKGIKSPSKLLSPKYLSQSSIIEQNKNLSSPKRVHFVNSIVILNKENEVEEEVEEETERETKEEEEDNPEHFETFPTMKELRYHEWLLKNPQPPWVKAKIRTGNVNNVKFSCMIGQFNKEQAYLDLESLIKVMSMLHYNWIMSNRLKPRRKPSNPKKNCNFVRRVKGLRVFVGNFTYECYFMLLEDTTSVIDHYLGSVVFGKPFMEATELVYNKEEGTVVFERDKKRIIFKMPHKMDMFKHVDFADRGTDSIPPFVIESDDDNYENPTTQTS